MRLYRATVWTLSSSAQAVEDVGEQSWERRIVSYHAPSQESFEASVMDDVGASRDVDMIVTFGPVSDVTR